MRSIVSTSILFIILGISIFSFLAATPVYAEPVSKSFELDYERTWNGANVYTVRWGSFYIKVDQDYINIGIAYSSGGFIVYRFTNDGSSYKLNTMFLPGVLTGFLVNGSFSGFNYYSQSIYSKMRFTYDYSHSVFNADIIKMSHDGDVLYACPGTGSFTQVSDTYYKYGDLHIYILDGSASASGAELSISAGGDGRVVTVLSNAEIDVSNIPLDDLSITSDTSKYYTVVAGDISEGFIFYEHDFENPIANISMPLGRIIKLSSLSTWKMFMDIDGKRDYFVGYAGILTNLRGSPELDHFGLFNSRIYISAGEGIEDPGGYRSELVPTKIVFMRDQGIHIVYDGVWDRADGSVVGHGALVLSLFDNRMVIQGSIHVDSSENFDEEAGESYSFGFKEGLNPKSASYTYYYYSDGWQEIAPSDASWKFGETISIIRNITTYSVYDLEVTADFASNRNAVVQYALARSNSGNYVLYPQLDNETVDSGDEICFIDIVLFGSDPTDYLNYTPSDPANYSFLYAINQTIADELSSYWTTYEIPEVVVYDGQAYSIYAVGSENNGSSDNGSSNGSNGSSNGSSSSSAAIDMSVLNVFLPIMIMLMVVAYLMQFLQKTIRF